MRTILDQRGNVVARVGNHGEHVVYMDRTGFLVARYVPNHDTTYDRNGHVMGKGDQGMRVLAEYNCKGGW